MSNLTDRDSYRTPCTDVPEMFDDIDRQREAQALCKGCWLLTECAQRPVPKDFTGTWGGKTYGRKSAQCATPAGYARHLRHKEVPCDPCTKAHTASRRALKEAARARRRREDIA